MERTVSDAIVDILVEWGVDAVFGLPGDGINGFVEALRKQHEHVRYVHVRHEEVAAMAASGYAKFSGKLGVCFATAAPGAIHLLNGLYDAKIDQAPVLAITGMTYHDLIGTSYLQDMNQDYLFQDVACYNQRIMGPAHVENVVQAACRAAISARGVAHVCIPIDIQAMPASEERRFKRNVPGHARPPMTVPARVPEREALERAAQLLGECKKIAILVGAGARGAGKEVEQVAERLAAPVAKAMLGKEVLPDDSPYTTGGVGVVGTRPSSEALGSCDGLLIVGSSFPYIEFYPEPDQTKAAVQIDDRPERIGLRHPIDVGLVGDARATLQELLPLLPRNPDRAFLEQAQAGMRDWWALMEERGTEGGTPMQPDVVMWHLPDLLRDDAIVCGDSGTVTTLLARMKLRAQQRFSFSGTLCSMAAGLPYAIGAQIAYPDRQVVAVVGDGAMSMMMGDLVTLCQHGLPVKIIVLKNNTLGLIKWEQMVYLGNPEYGVDLAPIDFVKVAEACGGRGLRIDAPRDCRALLQEALRLRGPVVVEAVIDKYAPPMPPKITKDQAKKLGLALVRGEPARRRVALTMTRKAVDESTFAASPFGVPARAARKLVGPPREAADTGRDGHDGHEHATARTALEAVGAALVAVGSASLVAQLRRRGGP